MKTIAATISRASRTLIASLGMVLVMNCWGQAVTDVVAEIPGGSKTVSITHGLPTIQGTGTNYGLTLLPTGFAPLGVSKSGVVVLTNGSSYYRWYRGQMLLLDDLADGWWINEIDINSRGVIAIAKMWRTYSGIVTQTKSLLLTWDPDSTSPTTFAPPEIVSSGYNCDTYYRYENHEQLLYLNRLDDLDNAWVDMSAGQGPPGPCGGSGAYTDGFMIQAGAATPLAFRWPNSIAGYNVGRQGIPYGLVRACPKQAMTWAAVV